MTTAPTTNPLTELDHATCQRLLNSHSIGRLAISNGHNIDLFAVRYVIENGNIYFQTKAGDNFTSIVVTRKVAFEIDEARTPSVRQVTVYGTAKWFPHDVDIAPELKDEARVASNEHMHWVELIPEKISGRELKLPLSGELPVQ